ncbi:MAG: ABC transporter substrate-binding protein, partial [Rhizobiaceae bacterium]|nr:ABC transporter substrate-binding protein [Rhizobiaceae bacterium]
MNNKTKIMLTAAFVSLLAAGASSAAGLDPKLQAMLPAKIKAAGEIKVGTEPQTPPYDFYAEDNKTITGLEKELR